MILRLGLLIVLFSFTGCICGGDDDDFGLDPIDLDCFDNEIVTTSSFDNLSTQSVSITDANVSGNFVTLGLAFSGCDVNRNFKLVIDEAQIKTEPPIQRAKIDLDEQLCQAFFQVPVCFDISKLERPVILRFETQQGERDVRIN